MQAGAMNCQAAEAKLRDLKISQLSFVSSAFFLILISTDSFETMRISLKKGFPEASLFFSKLLAYGGIKDVTDSQH